MTSLLVRRALRPPHNGLVWFGLVVFLSSKFIKIKKRNQKGTLPDAGGQVPSVGLQTCSAGGGQSPPCGSRAVLRCESPLRVLLTKAAWLTRAAFPVYNQPEVFHSPVMTVRLSSWSQAWHPHHELSLLLWLPSGKLTPLGENQGGENGQDGTASVAT